VFNILNEKDFKKDQTFLIKNGPSRTKLLRALNYAFSFKKNQPREVATFELKGNDIKEIDIIITGLVYDMKKPRAEKFNFYGIVKCADKKTVSIYGSYFCKQAKGEFTVVEI
jgi:hypothetical protein